jgi:hypothetical protein
VCSSARRALAIATTPAASSSARRRRDQEGRRDPANPVSLGTLGAKSGRSPTTASGSTRPARLTTPLLRTEPNGPVTAGGLERRHCGRAVAPAAVGAGPCTRTTRAPARCPPARSSCGSSTGNLRLCRECTPVWPAAYSSSPLLDTRELFGLKMSLQEQTRRASRREPIMNRTSRLAATVLVSGVLGLAGLGLAAGTAQAAPRGPYQWCPGQPLPATDVNWDMSVCHTWYRVDSGFQANVGSFVYEGDRPPANLGCAPIRCLPGI